MHVRTRTPDSQSRFCCDHVSPASSRVGGTAGGSSVTIWGHQQLSRTTAGRDFRFLFSKTAKLISEISVKTIFYRKLAAHGSLPYKAVLPHIGLDEVIVCWTGAGPVRWTGLPRAGLASRAASQWTRNDGSHIASSNGRAAAQRSGGTGIAWDTCGAQYHILYVVSLRSL